MAATLETTDVHGHGTDKPVTDAGPQLAAVLAEFNTPQGVTAAVRQVRAAGYTDIDAYTPFPFHDLDEALGVGKTRLPWISLSAAATGGSCAFLMQWWMNGVDYPLVISGKPLVSIPSSMPVIFACCILFASITTLITMLLLNGLPRMSNPLWSSERFRRVTNDRFFISVAAADPAFDRDAVMAVLRTAGALSVEECFVNPSEFRIPGWVWLGGITVASLLVIPPVLIAHLRVTESRVPRIHLIQDMDFQPKFKAQATNALFDDNRAARPQVSGTIARGFLEADDEFYRGLKAGSPDLAVLLAALPKVDLPDGTAPAGGNSPNPPAGGGAAVDPLDSLPWISQFPIAVDRQTMKRGQERFNIYCSTCHGLGGDGDGLITLRALELEQGTWVKPVSFHTDNVRNQPIGKLFHSVTFGVRKMPPMGDIIPEQDRWAILLYLRALQQSRNATTSDVPADLISTLQAQ